MAIWKSPLSGQAFRWRSEPIMPRLISRF